MDELFESCPEMDLAALEEEVLGGPLADDNYLFYRSGVPDCGWPEMDGEPGSRWELYCTSCHQRFYEPKRRGFKVSELAYCPQCGAKVDSKRWKARKKLQTRILYWKFQRGEGRQVWLRAYHVVHHFCPLPGDEWVEFREVARYLFEDGCAHEWARAVRYSGWDVVVEFRRRNRVTGLKWYISTMNGLAGTYPSHFCEIGRRDLEGSCLEYSQLPEAMRNGFDIPEYLDFYVKNPMIEYLWKFGLSTLLWDALMAGLRRDFRRAVNLRAKHPKDLLRGLTVQEVRRLTVQPGLDCQLVTVYQQLKKDGIVRNTPECWEWARAVRSAPESAELARAHGVGGKALRGYVEKQSRWTGRTVRSSLLDYGDYLRQLDALGIRGGNLLPQDLQAAHERLSDRQRKLVNRDKNRLFRTRRRLYSWMCWRHGGCLIRPVDSADEIIAEGEQQHNCVAGYADRHASRKTVILVLRRAAEPRRSWHTVELDPKTLTVRQCLGYRNGDAEPEAEEFIKAWVERLRRIQSGRKAA